MIQVLSGGSKVQILIGRNSTSGNPGTVLISLDAVISQDHSYKNTVSSYPVENGMDIVDHIRQDPDVLKIEGIVTNTPEHVYSTSDDVVLTAYQYLCRVAGRYATFDKDITVSNEYPGVIIVDIIGTRNRVYTDMVCDELSFPFTNDTGDSIQFTASFKKIRKATVNLATIDYTSSRLVGTGGVDRASDLTDLGMLPPEEMNKLQNSFVDSAMGGLDSMNNALTNGVPGWLK